MKNIYLTLVLLLTVISGMQAKDYDIIVAQDGSGDYKTVQEAINAVPDFRKEKETRIFIRNGNKLVLVNKTPTGRDSIADLVVKGSIGEIFSQL